MTKRIKRTRRTSNTDPKGRTRKPTPLAHAKRCLRKGLEKHPTNNALAIRHALFLARPPLGQGPTPKWNLEVIERLREVLDGIENWNWTARSEKLFVSAKG